MVAATAAAGTLDQVRARGYVQCGVSQGLPGFSNPDDKGDWKGLDVDICRAVAVAVFGDPARTRFTPTSSKERFTALQSGEIDLLARNTTWTFSRDVMLGLTFARISYFDGQGFMVRKDLGVNSVLELSGATLCTTTGTTTELNVADYFRSHGLEYQIVSYEKVDEVTAAYDAGRCDSYTDDMSVMYSQRIKLRNPDEHRTLPEVISKEPLGPLVRHGDDQWADIVRWVLNAMILGEELGVTSKNATAMRGSGNPEVRRLLGTEGNLGPQLGLSAAWAYDILRLVGNYGESFGRNLGSGSSLKLPRGLNAGWREGGLLYAPPIR
ncbi:MAG: amino acid ABC transporter substrate-binding protein [Sphingomonadales bacterium]